MELAVKRMFLGMLNSGVQAVRGGQEDRRGARRRESHDCGQGGGGGSCRGTEGGGHEPVGGALDARTAVLL